MATNRSRRPRDDDEDDRPRRRRYDDEDEDDRPRSRRRYDDEDDDRPARRPWRKSRGPSTGLILGVVGGGIALVAVIVVVILLSTGKLGGANISYAKFKEIRSGATIESLEKSFGRATRLERSDWSRVRYAPDRDAFDRREGRGGTLADLDPVGNMVEAWYYWHSGPEDIYVAVGKAEAGKSALIMKVYTNSDALKVNGRAGGDFSKMVPSFEVLPVN